MIHHGVWRWYTKNQSGCCRTDEILEDEAPALVKELAPALVKELEASCTVAWRRDQV
jgi:hypothetical protein